MITGPGSPSGSTRRAWITLKSLWSSSIGGGTGRNHAATKDPSGAAATAGPPPAPAFGADWESANGSSQPATAVDGPTAKPATTATAHAMPITSRTGTTLPTVSDTSRMTLVMGVVNVTPDSFSDGGEFLDPARAVEHAAELVREGADVLDIGGESTRPGAAAVSAEEECDRVVPVLDGLVGVGVPISIDTSKAEVAEAALDAGASWVNDVTALRADPALGPLCADRGCEVVLMHMLGDPRTMQDDPRYGDVVDDVRSFLADRIEVAVSAGIAEERIWVDPGIGFGKTVEHNLELLRRLGELRSLGRPILVGASRKSFIGKISGREPGERVGGTIATTVVAAAGGADAIRVHDVRATRDALRVKEAILAGGAAGRKTAGS